MSRTDRNSFGDWALVKVALDGLEKDSDGMSLCPECGGVVEITPSLAVQCREYGSGHYRQET